jgi:hypothetical protein
VKARQGMRLSSAAVVACAMSVASCGLFYGFDRYDTDIGASALDGAVADGAVGSSDFEVVVVDGLRIEPGTSSPLVVELKRSGPSAERVVVLMADPLPAGVVRAPAATIEPDRSSTTMTVAVRSDAPATTQTLHLTATSATRTRTKDVSVTARGLPCAADRRFGLDVPGTVQFDSNGKGAIADLGLVASADGSITLGLGDPFTTVYRLDATGRESWGQAATSDTLGIAVDAMLGVELATPGKVFRYASDSSPDSTYDGTIPMACAASAVVRGDSSMTVVCSDATASFGFSRFDASGIAVLGDVIPFGFGITAKAVSSSASASGIVACGVAGDGTKKYSAFARWLPSGKRDEGFGTSGGARVGLAPLDSSGTLSSPIACLTDGAGVVALLAGNADRAMLALTPKGAIDTSFGSGGIVLLQSDVATSVDTAALAFDQGAVLAAASTSAGTFVVRYSRTGQLDTAFGKGGYCPIGAAAAAESVSAIALTADHTLLILTTGLGRVKLSAIWL